jgi:hypothetical protein
VSDLSRVSYVVAIRITVPIDRVVDAPLSDDEVQTSVDAIASSAIEVLQERFPVAKLDRLTYINLEAWAPGPE